MTLRPGAGITEVLNVPVPLLGTHVPEEGSVNVTNAEYVPGVAFWVLVPQRPTGYPARVAHVVGSFC
jgi:hypothetical protein